MKLLFRLLSTWLVLGLAGLAIHLAVSPADGSAERPPTRFISGDWVAPGWYPPSTTIYALPALEHPARPGADRPPRVRAAAALVFDVDASTVIYEKNPDTIQPVASLTKLVASLAMVASEPDLDATITINAEHYPTRSGARSKLSTDDRLQGWDVLGAALVASDNRGAYSLASAVHMDIDPFIARMNEVSGQLMMELSTWSDPSGLEDENLSTARDMARATLAVAAHPLLSSVASAPFWDLHYDRRPVRRLFTTNRLSARGDLTIEAAKTGYTDTARYCYTTALYSHGRHLVITLLGARSKRIRWQDVDRLLRWASKG